MSDGGETRHGTSDRRRIFALAIGGAGLALVVVAAITLTDSPSSTPSSPLDEFAYPNGDRANTRFVEGPIRATNVSDLAEAWSLPLQGGASFGAHWSSPTIANGVIYSQDSDSDVQAIDLGSGRVLWEKEYGATALQGNGVVIAHDRVYGATPTTVFALDRATGQERWRQTLPRSSLEGISMAPGYSDGLVYVSTIPAELTGGAVGVLWALDADTGEKVWSFETVSKGLWGNPSVNFGGGVTESPAFDKGGSMYFGVGSPGPYAGTPQEPWGSSRPGPNLYTSSIVKLDAKTGKLDWYYQLTPHALCNWDLQGPPILLKAGKRDLAIAAGRAGIVIALDQHSGELIWKRPVGIHNGHDNDGTAAMRGNYSNLEVPMKVYPGEVGGVAAAPSTNGSTVFVPVVNHPTTLVAQETGSASGTMAGELVALDVRTGAIRWKHRFPAALFAATIAVNDLVFVSTFDGALYAFEAGSGKLAWQTSLPAGTQSGIEVGDDTLIAPAGTGSASGQGLQMVAYRLGAGG